MKNIFVSSTFTDFQKERDILREDVMSRLNDIAISYGEYVSFSDLRWGIDTLEVKEEDVSGIILSSCLDEIDRTRPYMIILLGNRYGFIPGEEAVQREINRKEFNLEDLEISVTHLEIEYGAFRAKDTNHIYVYLREADNDNNSIDSRISNHELTVHTKLIFLKEKLIKLFGNHVHTYSRCDLQTGKFADMVYSDLSDDFNQEWSMLEKMSIYEKELIVEQHAVEERASFFEAFKEYALILESKLYKSDYRKIALTGSVGSGKSTMFSFLASTLNKKGWDTIPFLSGNTVFSVDEKSIALTIVWKLEKLLNLKNEYIFEDNRSVNEVKEYLDRLYALYEETGRKLFIGVDALEQIISDEKYSNLWFLPEKNYKNIYTIVTTWKDELIVRGEYELCPMPLLSYQEKLNVIDGILHRNGKKLSKMLVKEIIRVPSADNPLMLYLVVNRLCLMNSMDFNAIYNKGGGIEEINQQQLRIVHELPKNAGEMARHILSFMSEILNMPQALDAMYLMAASRYGLRYDDLYAILSKINKEILPLQFSRFINLLYDMFLIRDDGRVDFAHQSFRTTMRHYSIHDYDGMIAEHLLGLPRKDIVRREEVTYHLISAEMDEALVQEISAVFSEESRYAAKDIYYMSNKVPDYILGIVNKQIQKKGISNDLINFISYYNNYVIKLSFVSMESIERELISLEHLNVRLKDLMSVPVNSALAQQIRYTYIWICLSIGHLYLEKHTDEAYSKALPYYQKVINHAKELYNSDPSSFALMELGVAYHETACILERLGGENNSNKAFEYNKMAYVISLKVFEKQGYATNSDLLNYMIFAVAFANNCIDKRDDNLTVDAIELLKNIIQVVSGVLSEESMPKEILEEYAKLHLSLGNAYTNQEMNQENDEAITNYKKYLDLIKLSYLKSADNDNMHNLSTANINLAKAYSRFGDKESLMTACSYAENAVRYSKRLYIRNDKFESLNIYGIALSTYAKVLSEIGEYSLLAKGKEAIYEAMKLIAVDNSDFADRDLIFFWNHIIHGMVSIAGKTRERELLLKTLNLAISIKARFNADFFNDNYDSELAHSFLCICDAAANVCQLLGEKKTTEIGIEFSKESLNVIRKVIEVEGEAPFLMRSLELSLFKVGIALRENRSKANEILPYLEQGLEIAKKLAEISDTYEKQCDYGFALLRNAETLMTIDDVSYLLKAKEYVLKAIEIRNKIFEKGSTIQQHIELAHAYRLLFYISLKLEDVKTAKESIDTALNIIQEQFKIDSSPQILNELADSECEFAEYLLQVGKLSDAVRYFELASYHFSMITHDLGTFTIYKKYISTILRTGDAYARIGNYDETLKYVRLSVSESKKYLGFEKELDYRVLMVDIYMAAEPILNKLIASGVESSKVYSIMIDMYKESIDIYQEAMSSNKDLSYISNFSALLIGLARILVKNNQKDEAVLYYNVCISLMEAFPNKSVSTFTMITNEYRSYAEKGLIYLDMKENYDALSMFAKSIELSGDAISFFEDDEKINDICDDVQEYALIAAKISFLVEEYEKTEFYLKLALMVVEKLISSGLSEKYQDAYSEINSLMLALLMKSTDMPNQTFNNKDIELQRMYENAEYRVSSNTEKAKRLFVEFLEAEGDISDEEKSGQTLIYSYNAWSQMAAIEINSHEDQQQVKGIEYLLKAVQRELEVLNVKAANNRRMEIISDLSQDAMNGFKLCRELGYQEQMKTFMEALFIAKTFELK